MRMIAVEVVEGLPSASARVDAEDDRRHFVDVRNDALGIDQNDAVFEALDDRLGLALFINDAIDVELLELLEALGHPIEFGGDALQFGERLLAETHRRAAQAEAAQALGQFVERLGEIPRDGP